MYKRGIYTVISNRPLTETVYEMVLTGDMQYITAPGQFVNVELEGKFLRRPLSVCDYDDKTVTLVYKVVGSGTEQMGEMEPGTELDILTGLGNGFTIQPDCRKVLVVGGGVGVPPLYNLTKRLIDAGQYVTVILGFNTGSEVFYKEEFEALGATVILATADGSQGIKGFVTDAIKECTPEYDYIYACGPIPMLEALGRVVEGDGQFSFEERMGCGFGGCMGCTCKTKYGNKRICREGPVLTLDEIIW